MAITTIFVTLLGSLQAKGAPAAARRLLAFGRTDASGGRPVRTWRAATEGKIAAGQGGPALRDPWAGVAMTRLFRAANARRLAA